MYSLKYTHTHAHTCTRTHRIKMTRLTAQSPTCHFSSSQTAPLISYCRETYKIHSTWHLYTCTTHSLRVIVRFNRSKTSKLSGRQKIHTSAAARGRLPGWHCRPGSRWSTSRRSDTCRQQGHIWVNWSQHTRAQANRHTESSTAQERRTWGRAETRHTADRPRQSTG